jgi:hypothetical protein
MTNFEETDSTRFCIECKAFLPVHMFQHWCRRTICKTHYNERMRLGKQQAWTENPQKRQANIAWQIAYTDSKKVYERKLNITPAQVLNILERASIPPDSVVRLVPLDPSISLSMDNFCLTSQKNRMDLANVWRKLKCNATYHQFFSPEAKRPIYASSCEKIE